MVPLASVIWRTHCNITGCWQLLIPFMEQQRRQKEAGGWVKFLSQETPVKPPLFLVPGHDPSSDQSHEPLNVDFKNKNLKKKRAKNNLEGGGVSGGVKGVILLLTAETTVWGLRVTYFHALNLKILWIIIKNDIASFKKMVYGYLKSLDSKIYFHMKYAYLSQTSEISTCL